MGNSNNFDTVFIKFPLVTDLLLLAETGASLEERRRPDTTALLVDANILAKEITGFDKVH